MTSEAGDPRKALERERDRLDGILDGNDAWRALRLIEEREAEGRPVSAVDAAALRTHIEAALAGDRVYQARLKLSEAITLLESPAAAVSVSSEPATVSASAARPPDATPLPVTPSPAPADDLTRIRGIDSALAARLNAIGVDSFAAIAGWRAADVRRVTEALGLDRRIHRQNWIEQAALFVSQRRSRVAEAPPPPVSAAAAPPVAAPRFVEVAAKPYADLVATAVRNILAKAAPPALTPPAPVASVQTSPALQPDPAPAAVAPTPPAADDLAAIRGLDARAAAILAGAGITTYAAIARCTATDVARLRDMLGAGAQWRSAQWIEQAAMLAAGHPTRFIRTQPLLAAIPLLPRPATTAVARDEGFGCELRQMRPAAIPAQLVPSAALASPPPAPSPEQAIAVVLPSEVALTSMFDLHAIADTTAPAFAAAPVEPSREHLAVAVLPPQPVEAARPTRAAFALPPLALRTLPDPSGIPEPSGMSQPSETAPRLDAAPPEDRAAAEYDPVIDYESDSLLDIAAMNFAEADVQIVPATSSLIDDVADDPRPLIYGTGAGTLQSRLRKAGDPDDLFDSRGYAAYRSAVEEAAVEIVHRGSGAREKSAAEARPPANLEDGGPKTVRRFLKALTGQDR